MSDPRRKNILLNGEQLVEQSKKIEEFVLLSRGNKLSTEEEEREDSDSFRNEGCLENLKSMLDLERVVLSAKISRGIFESNENRVQILLHCGKWNVGYFEDNVNYLKPHEALHMMEMRRLEVLYETVIMSIEQAYSIFLDPRNGVSFEQYLVYSYLVRAGYFVLQHDPLSDRLKHENLFNKTKRSKEDEMVWCVLMEKLKMPVSTKFISEEINLYEETKACMDKFCERIRGSHEVDCELIDESVEISNNKRECSAQDEPSCKRQKSGNNESQTENFLDVLKSETDYFTYQQIFQKFSFVKRAENFKPPESNLSFHFDVFLPKANFKKSEDLSNYRVVVIRSADKFPSNVELEHLRRQQSYKCEIILAIVSESMTLHFCACTF